MDKLKSYINVDENGVWRVAGTPISIDSVVIGFQQGQSAEEIQRNYPSLSLEQVYGTIACYLARAEEVDAYLKQQHAQWEQFRTKADDKPSAAVQRLRRLRASKTEQVR